MKKINVKVFATDNKVYKSYLEYKSKGKSVITKALGTPQGEDLTIWADEGSFIKVICAFGKAHFETDDTFGKKVSKFSDHILIKVPRYGHSNMFVVDAHFGSAHRIMRDICLAYGGMENASVAFDEETAKKEVA